MFEIGASSAKDLMSAAGATAAGVGLESTVARDRLADYVRYTEAEREMARRKRVADAMRISEEEKALARVPIVLAERQDEWVRLADLQKVVLEPGRLEIRFDGWDDLLHQVWMFSRALVNQTAVMEKIVAKRSVSDTVGGGSNAKAS